MSVVTNSAFVFATDFHNIAAYSRASDGSLKQSASTVAVTNAGTANAYAIGSLNLDHSGQTIYAAEAAGSDDSYYFFFSIGANGAVTKIGQIGPNVDYGSPLVFSPDNNYAYGSGCFHLGWNITSFRRNSDGSLTPFDSTANSQSGPAFLGSNQQYCPEGEAVSQIGYLAVTDTAAGQGGVGVGTYHINGDGTLSFVQSSTTTTQLQQGNSCCYPIPMAFDPNGTYLAIAGTNGIQVFQLQAGGGLTSLGGAQAGGPTYSALQWDKDGHLYATGSGNLYVFTSSNGVLTPAPGSPHATAPGGSLAVLPTH